MQTLTRVAFAAMVATAVTASAAAAAQSGSTIQLRGTVAVNCSVAVTDLNQTLNISGGETNKQVGTVTENCNRGNGYKITVGSANAGKLVSGAAGTSPIMYTTIYDGQSGNAGSLEVLRSQAQFNKVSSVNVTIPASAQYIAGDYADTLTITIAAR
ncbi:hypothetical protein [Rhodocista pekingensis]|uniref:Spore coat protein U domain-containing protein n=1 Tax=Rhodocista pekingensis TaxID=201185 RepID=A0ABW2L0U7_9PROT